MPDTSARKLNAMEREERRRRFLDLRGKFKRERPGESPVKLIAKVEGISICLVYDVLRGRR